MSSSIAAALADRGLQSIADRLARPGDSYQAPGSYSLYTLWGHGWLPFLRSPRDGMTDHSMTPCDHAGFSTRAEAIAFGQARPDHGALARGYTLDASPPRYGVLADIVPPSDSPMGRHFADLAEQAEARHEYERWRAK